jgi:hypothetical protein
MYINIGKQAVSQLNRKLNTPEIPKNLAEAGVTGVPVAPSTPTQGNITSFQSGIYMYMHICIQGRKSNNIYTT